MFTPPRDDFAGIDLPGQINEPRELSRADKEDQSTVQAIALLCRVVCFSLVVGCIIGVSYSIESLVIKEPITLHCKGQRIKNGRLMSGVKGSTAVVVCDDGFEKGPPVMVKCLMVTEKCVITKKATVLKEEVKKCWRRYAYVSPGFADQSLLNVSMTVQQINDEEKRAIPGVCLAARLNKNEQASKLFQQRQRPTVLRSHRQSLFMASSTASLAAIVLVPMAVLLVAGMARTIAREIALRPPRGYTHVQVEADDELPEGQE